jgi:hydroxyacylglutathione hydrolase
MLLERIVSPGLAHYSYLVGDRNEAMVIDPRRDCEIYVENATDAGMRIVNIFETHRNEDYVIGSPELAKLTGAEVWHADAQWDYKYGRAARAGQRWKAGRLEVEAVATPGHTPGSMSYLLMDSGGLPWMVFTGDALFAGDVGRTDLLGREMSEENAALLYHSIFSKLISLGDGIIVCPAHGAGSVCGESIAERLWTTIGIERRFNPKLQAKTLEEFVAGVMKSPLERPPYFRRMEEVNLQAELPRRRSATRPLSPGDFDMLAKDAQVLDTRMELGFSAAHLPAAQNIWLEGLASFAGWFLTYERPILLVAEDNDPTGAVNILGRLGFDDIAGYLAGGMLAWHMAGLESSSLATITVQSLCHLIDAGTPVWILDVRSDEELGRDGAIAGAQHIHVTQLPERGREVPADRMVYVFCGSGLRSMIAASYLQARGWRDLRVVLGGLAGWKSRRCSIQRG